MDSKRKIKNDMHVTTYYWKDLTCELCKVQLPDTVQIGGRVIKLIDYRVPSCSPYAVLETYSHNDAKSRVLHVLNFGGASALTVGRGRDSNVKVSDNSVSRTHSELVYVGGKFYQMDMASKFGTLKIFRRPLKIKKSLTIQAGKTVIGFALVTPRENCCLQTLGCIDKPKVSPYGNFDKVSITLSLTSIQTQTHSL